MRDAFFSALAQAADRDPTLWALTGDLGIGLFDEFERRAPGRFLNVGIAEQALVGVAAGLAYCGQRAVVYSIAPFLTARAHEQVRIDVAMAHANVTLVGVGGGMAYGYLGPTHHATEDLAVMRALPGMTVLAPGDPGEAREAALTALALDGPVYLRLGKNGEPRLLEPALFALGRARRLADGQDVVLASTGAILAQVLEAAEALRGAGIRPTVLHYPTLKPFDAGAVVSAARSAGAVVTVEEHTVIGGLGSAVAEALAEAGAAASLRRLGLADTFAVGVGSQRHLQSAHGLSAPAIARACTELVRAGCGALEPREAAGWGA
ncbi:MAG TPA: transketolase C-terminal domain-containing protein [Solirubrobacteraceae bacterium]|nr:transketolase C-terminal domain-containing protein [Solirubrobacteraceae bacterium]